jgi:hypothetical protein
LRVSATSWGRHRCLALAAATYCGPCLAVGQSRTDPAAYPLWRSRLGAGAPSCDTAREACIQVHSPNGSHGHSARACVSEMDRGRRRARWSPYPSPSRRRPSPAAPQPTPNHSPNRRRGAASLRPAAQASIAVSACLRHPPEALQPASTSSRRASATGPASAPSLYTARLYVCFVYAYRKRRYECMHSCARANACVRVSACVHVSL